MTKKTILFIHGLWMHSNTWEPWMKFFSGHGYQVLNPGWPGDGETVELWRANPQAVANYGVKSIADHYARQIEALKEVPILVGHSFGGLLVQNLLGRGLGAAAVAIDPAPIQGVWQLPLSALRASLPVLGNPFNLKKSISLTYPQFRYAFANALPETEARELYDRCTVPSPARPLFQVAMATLNPNSETRVNTSNENRGPLLITAGEKDHIVPPLLSMAAFKKYAKSKAVTDFKLFEGRGHSLAIDHGWNEVAAYSLQWLNRQGL
ncbi:MAG: alpha/beta hydrolase [Bacteroidetes bacterium]|nr:alpha/beta hydrolase [Bacteroidota bacterium]